MLKYEDREVRKLVSLWRSTSASRKRFSRFASCTRILVLGPNMHHHSYLHTTYVRTLLKSSISSLSLNPANRPTAPLCTFTPRFGEKMFIVFDRCRLGSYCLRVSVTSVYVLNINITFHGKQQTLPNRLQCVLQMALRILRIVLAVERPTKYTNRLIDVQLSTGLLFWEDVHKLCEAVLDRDSICLWGAAVDRGLRTFRAIRL